jgi:hypothetical protein
MKRAPIVNWYGPPPTPAERAALARAAAAGKLPRVSNATRGRVRSLAPAAAAFRDFHWGENPAKVTRTRLPSYAKGLLKLGDLRAVEYEASKGGQRAIWVHKFSRPYPTLTATPTGRLGPIVGGAAYVTSRGIEK